MLVNVGVSMEMWSGGKFKATFHRVVFPSPPPANMAEESGVVLPGRKSVVFFMIPDLPTVSPSSRPVLLAASNPFARFVSFVTCSF